MTVKPRAARFLKTASLYLAAWSPVAVIYAALLHEQVPATWRNSAIYAATYLLPAILLGIPAVLIAHRLVDRNTPWQRWIIVHGALAIAFTLLWHSIFYSFLLLTAGIEAVRGAASGTWPWQLSYGALVYGPIAGIASAVHSNRRMREHEVAAARAESLRARAEMQALRGQLDPHFLFNTLHSITALVRSDARQAEEALVQFGALLRRLLDVKRDGIDEVSLAEEMKFVDGYLALEQLRLGERLRVERHLSPGALACFVPVLSIQPLVENAIRHALAPRRDGGTLAISADVASDRLEITVRDDGPGADPNDVANAPGTGLSVTRQRVHLRHGSSGSLVVTTTRGSGFAVTLSIPAVTEPVFATAT